MKTSARNQFVGSVVAIADAGGMADVRLRLDGGDELVAAITPESVETMALRPGVQAYALIKAPWVTVAANAPRRDPKRNVFDGTVTTLATGKVSTQLSLTTPGGRAIAAAMPQSLVESRGLRRGARAWASFPTDSVILATFE